LKTFKGICRTIIRVLKQAFLPPPTVAHTFKQRRRQVALTPHEAERLDRLRNPSNYLGK
jgi:hypothetical protein